ncbi:MAG: hypothetical protein JWP96_1340 [Polaromonas sp.]|nr:hypothetical protein [Polaromonas sp.]
MKFALKSLNSLVLAGLLATAGASAMAQDAPAKPAPATAASAGMHPDGHGGHHRMGHRDPAKMQAMMAKHHAELKAKLKITPAQEGAWTTFTAAMQPPEHMMGQRLTPEQRAEFDKLPTPERIDKMRVVRTQRMADMTAAMDKRGEATKAFYAVLSSEQKKTFDAGFKMHGRHGGAGHHEGGMKK